MIFLGSSQIPAAAAFRRFFSSKAGLRQNFFCAPEHPFVISSVILPLLGLPGNLEFGIRSFSPASFKPDHYTKSLQSQRQRRAQEEKQGRLIPLTEDTLRRQIGFEQFVSQFSPRSSPQLHIFLRLDFSAWLSAMPEIQRKDFSFPFNIPGFNRKANVEEPKISADLTPAEGKTVSSWKNPFSSLKASISSKLATAENTAEASKKSEFAALSIRAKHCLEIGNFDLLNAHSLWIPTKGTMNILSLQGFLPPSDHSETLIPHYNSGNHEPDGNILPFPIDSHPMEFSVHLQGSSDIDRLLLTPQDNSLEKISIALGIFTNYLLPLPLGGFVENQSRLLLERIEKEILLFIEKNNKRK